MSLASVDIPPEANVPPALEKLGVDPQTTLNCELLDLNFGLELRWTLASSESDDEPGGIILQLVSRTASDRYLAFGIRQPKDTQSSEAFSKNDNVRLFGLNYHSLTSFQTLFLEML